MTKKPYLEKDVELIRNSLKSLPTGWDGKESILKLKEVDYQWKQMEWIGWYFEVLCKEKLIQSGFEVPGKKYGNVEFDSFKTINWDIKASAIKSHSHQAVLNDISATNQSIEQNGSHGVIIGLVDVEYNDEDRTFQKWHTKLKGGLSKYEKDRIKRNAFSRYRKTKAELKQVLFVAIDNDNKDSIGTYSQGRNSDGSPRNPKYMIDIEKSEEFEVGKIDF